MANDAKYVRIMCEVSDGKSTTRPMTSIVVRFGDGETDFHAAKARALGYITEELCRYGLHEALNAIGIYDDAMRARMAEFDARHGRKPGG